MGYYSSSSSTRVWVFLLLALLSYLGDALDLLVPNPSEHQTQQFPAFGFQRFDRSSNFESQFALTGDVKAGKGGVYLQITNSSEFSSGRVIYKQPIKLSNGNSKGESSFGTYFTFSLTPESGDGLVFLMMSNIGKNSSFAVEFDTKKDVKYGDLNENHVGIDLNNSLVSVKVANASKVKIVLNSGKKLQCWIDYEASAKRVEVRLSKSAEMRPVEPLLTYLIDLSKVFRDEEVWFGLSSSSANSSQVCRIYSWSFKLRPYPYWMHSQPLDPNALFRGPEVFEPEPMAMHKKSECVLRVFTAIIVGTGCGAIGAFFGLLVWTFLTSRLQVMPEEFAAPKVEYDCDKVKMIVVDKPLKESKK